MNKGFSVFAFFLCLLSSLVGEQKQPNILVFLVDDMGLMDTSVPFIIDKKGQEEIHPFNKFFRTPSMERLAKQGIRFSQFYAMSVCSPTRASILNGQTSATHTTTQFIGPDGKNTGTYGPEAWNWEGVRKQDVVLPMMMKEAGYHTIFCGKAHFGPVGYFGEEPKNFGFDVNIAGCAYGRPGSYLPENHYGAKMKKGKANRAIPGLAKYHGSDVHLSEALTLEFNVALEQAAKMNKPFFAYMSHYAVHSPFEMDQRFAANYNSKQGKMNEFGTLVEGMDKSLGDIMDQLDKLGIAEDTLIFFLGDNGSDAPAGPVHEVACAAPLRGKKGTHYEGGMRVPFIAAWAKANAQNPYQKAVPIAQGKIIPQMGTVYDLVPTILNISGAKAPKGHALDGQDIQAHFKGDHPQEEREFLMHFPHKHRSSYFTSYRKGDWKLIYHYHHKEKDPFDKIELYHLPDDRDESNNLAKSHPERLKEMFRDMNKSLERSKAQYPLAEDKQTLLKPVL